MQFFHEVAAFCVRSGFVRQMRNNKNNLLQLFVCLCALVLAATAVSARVSSAWYDTSKLLDRVVPLKVCSIVQSIFGETICF
jgi:hypothetical protein